MQALNRILAATDFSPTADRAVRRAAMLARETGADLYLLHVVHPLNLYAGQEIDADALDEVALGAAGERMGALAEMLAEHCNIRTHAAGRIGRAHARIAEHARDVQADLVVVGARGENPLVQLLLGSTANRLLRVYSGAVLIVRNADVRPYDHVLAAVDFSPITPAVLTWARWLASGTGLAVLHVLHVLEPELYRRMPEGEREQVKAEMHAIAESLMADLLSGLPGENAGHIESGYPPERVLEWSRRWRADLVVLGRHRPGLEDYLLGSVCKSMTQTADCDVLVTP